MSKDIRDVILSGPSLKNTTGPTWPTTITEGGVRLVPDAVSKLSDDDIMDLKHLAEDLYRAHQVLLHIEEQCDRMYKTSDNPALLAAKGTLAASNAGIGAMLDTFRELIVQHNNQTPEVTND